MYSFSIGKYEYETQKKLGKYQAFSNFTNVYRFLKSRPDLQPEGLKGYSNFLKHFQEFDTYMYAVDDYWIRIVKLPVNADPVDKLKF